ncbi:radical SAM protein [Candidatus Omnitrophota bacterium]
MNIWKKILKGVETSGKAFCGPHTVQIDLTDWCNSSCISCWVHSPLIDKKKAFPFGKKELAFNKVKAIIKELARSGTREIILSGSGEPLIYPQIIEVIKLIKSKKMYLTIITNATLLNEEMCKVFVKSKVDLLTASVWAGSPKVYVATHPNNKESDFETIRSNLKKLADYKQKSDSFYPYVKMYNVICSNNYSDINAMVDFAADVKANSIEFQIVDIIKGKTDALALDNEIKKKLFVSFEEIMDREDFVKGEIGKEELKDVTQSKTEKDFGKIWRNLRKGFILLDRIVNIVCPRGRYPWKGIVKTGKISPTQSQDSRFRFLFGKHHCGDCTNFPNCFPSQKPFIDVEVLNLLGIKSFIQRMFSQGENQKNYEQQINHIPCYMGWYYSRILTNGEVLPCCKASSHPLGNIYEGSFSDVWNGPKYNEFRSKAKNLAKSHPYFSKIECFKGCDNLGMNLEINTKANRSKSSGKHIIIGASDWVRGNFSRDPNNFGKGIVLDGGMKKGYAEYYFDVDATQTYAFYARYTTMEFRPVDIYIDNELIKLNALNSDTGGWTAEFLLWHKEFEIELGFGKHILKIVTENCAPHMEKFAFFLSNNVPAFIKKERNHNYLQFIKHHVLLDGYRRTVGKIFNTLKYKNIKDRYLEVLGVFDGKHGYKGPFHVQIDLTNDCNNHCIACWCNSPLFKEPRFLGNEKKAYLPLNMAKELLDEITYMGATEVYYSGSGEPLMHPQIMEILEHTKKNNLVCHLNTNFTLLNKQKIDCLMALEVDFLTVSTWAATPDTYVKTHPGRTEDDFCRIEKNLIYLNDRKQWKPHIKLYNVIFNMNYFEIEKMIDFAIKTKSESVEFTLVDTIPGATDELALNKKQIMELHKMCNRIKSKLTLDYKIAGSDVMLFQFDQFLRRISILDDAQDAKYDKNIIDSMPCYIGWLFARVLPNGEVHSCLKAHRIPTGSLYLNKFSEIWNSEKQIQFRENTICRQKSDPFFRLIGNDPNIKEAGCYKSCDDIGRNTWMHKRVRMLTLLERVVLKNLAQGLKIARQLKPKKESYKRYHKKPLLAGVMNGRKAFVGPEQVVVDLTNKCNLRCVSCWLYSPVLTKDKPVDKWLNEELAKESAFRLIDDLSLLGTKRIRFTGGGEPFMHKDFMEIVEHARNRNLQVALTTNFTLATKDKIKKLMDLGLEELCISTWASNPEVYSAVHQGVSSRCFEQLKENLLLLKQIKKDKPRLTFANVIMNNNYRDFEGIYEFGKKYGADSIYYTLVDIFKGQTDKFLLSKQEREELLKKAQEIKERNKGDSIQLEFFDGFLRRASTSQSEFEKGEFDKADIDKIPCYVGWIFSRVLADGSVAPCCRGVKKIMGDINKTSFKDIWFSNRYNEFRSKAKYASKDISYFKDIGCKKECDNLMHNEEMEKVLRLSCTA